MVRTLDVPLPRWIERRGGHFVGLSSLADDVYDADAPSYSASKAAMSNYLVSLGVAFLDVENTPISPRSR